MIDIAVPAALVFSWIAILFDNWRSVRSDSDRGG